MIGRPAWRAPLPGVAMDPWPSAHVRARMGDARVRLPWHRCAVCLDGGARLPASEYGRACLQ